MRAKNGLIIQKIDDDFYLIDSGEEEPRFNGMIKLNETSHFIIKKLMEKSYSLEELYEEIMKEYDCTLKEVESSVPEVIDQLQNVHIIVE